MERWPGVPGGRNLAGWDTELQRLWFFLTVRDRRAWCPPAGVGLLDQTRGWVLLTDRGIGLKGDSRLVEELRTLVEEWMVLEKPSLTRYLLRFTPCGGHVVPPADWSIERRHHTQEVSLA